MIIKKHIPNTITCCNLICGCIATGLAFKGDLQWALGFIILGAIFDFFDGFAARMLHVSSPIGKELDSLADDITFGMAPATIVYSLLTKIIYPEWAESFSEYIPYIAFVIAAFSALRLAKFNLDERQTTSFIGLPTPANALFWGSLAIGLYEYFITWEYSIYVLILLVFLSSYLLIAEIPMFALKIKTFSWRDNKLRYIFLLSSVVLLCLLGIAGLSAVILWYVILSVCTQKKV